MEKEMTDKTSEDSKDKVAKYRVFNCLQYEVNPRTGISLGFSEQNILNCIAHKSIKRYAYILHDKDTVTEHDIATGKGLYDDSDLGKLKLPHWHLVLDCDNTPLPISTIAKWLGIPEYMIEIPKGRGAFIDCVGYLPHSDIKQVLKRKALYDSSEVKANFDWQVEVDKMILRKTKYEKPLSEEDFIKNEVLYNGLRIGEVSAKYPTLYQKEMQVIRRLRLEYLSRFAELPPYRVNYYIEGQSGYGKDTMAYSIARSLFPGLGDDSYFEIGSKKVTFDGYDGEPVIIWSEFRASTFVETLGGYEQVLSSIDIIPKRKKREHKKFGDLRLVNSINIVTSTEPFETFLRGLIPAHDPDPTQSNRRFPIWIRIHKEDFDISINSGYLNKDDYSDYESYKIIKGSFGDVGRRLSSHPNLRLNVEEHMTTPIIQTHGVVSQGIQPDAFVGMTDDEILSQFDTYGVDIKDEKRQERERELNKKISRLYLLRAELSYRREYDYVRINVARELMELERDVYPSRQTTVVSNDFCRRNPANVEYRNIDDAYFNGTGYYSDEELAKELARSETYDDRVAKEISVPDNLDELHDADRNYICEYVIKMRNKIWNEVYGDV